MEVEKFNIEESVEGNKAKIKVIGVGGGGTNMINRVAQDKELLPVTLIAANTDAQHLEASKADIKIQLGDKLTKGLGAGMNPEVGRNSALESESKIRDILQGADIIFVAAGLGGGTGTGAAPVIAKIAREIGALTISIVTTPFKYEGKKREKLANQGLEEMEVHSDSIVIIPNSKLSAIIDKSTSYRDAFKIVDSILFRAVNGMCGVIINHGDGDMNVDFADLKTVMKYKGRALMGIGEASGERSAINALKNAIESPLLENVSLEGASGALIHFQFNPNYPLLEIEESMNYIHESVDEYADVIFGTTPDEAMDESQIKVTIIATGFNKKGENSPSILETDTVDMMDETQIKPDKANIQEIKHHISDDSDDAPIANTIIEKKEEEPKEKKEEPNVELSLQKIISSIDNLSSVDSNDLDYPTVLRNTWRKK